jgi:hypothetical protein
MQIEPVLQDRQAPPCLSGPDFTEWMYLISGEDQR